MRAQRAGEEGGRRPLLPALLAALAVLAAAPAHAHVLDGGGSLGAGFAHPFLGLDHLLAMVAVGVWAAQLGGAWTWRVPVAFVAVMAAGALAGAAGIALPGVEAGIAASVVVAGILIAWSPRLPAWAPVAVVALFAVFHGHAHGAELPAGASWLGYGAGFVAATALLHAAGIALAHAGRALGGTVAPRLLGALAGAGGVWLIAG
ncbi:MAG: HupE/UreJ family protein [Rhodospirillales bacterium]